MSDELDRSEIPEEESGLKVNLYYWLQALVLALVALIVVFTFFGRIIGVVGHSMDNTLADGEILLLQSIAYTPQQGDIVVLNEYTSPVLEGKAIVKRCIAVEGQRVQIDYAAGTVSVDGQVLDEPYLPEPMWDPMLVNSSMNITDVTVPEGHIFVMGDNRNDSTDSRHEQVGVIDQRYVLGRALFVIFPLNRIGTLF